MSIQSRHVINGREGRLFFDGEELAEIKSFEATVEKTKEEVHFVGRVMSGHKAGGATGTGTLTLHKTTSRFTRIMLEYIKSGVDRYFTIQGVLDDKNAGRGAERVTLYSVNLDSVKVGALDVETSALEEEIPFTFEDIDLPEALSSTFN